MGSGPESQHHYFSAGITTEMAHLFLLTEKIGYVCY